MTLINSLEPYKTQLLQNLLVYYTGNPNKSEWKLLESKLMQQCESKLQASGEPTKPFLMALERLFRHIEYFVEKVPGEVLYYFSLAIARMEQSYALLATYTMSREDAETTQQFINELPSIAEKDIKARYRAYMLQPDLPVQPEFFLVDVFRMYPCRLMSRIETRDKDYADFSLLVLPG